MNEFPNIGKTLDDVFGNYLKQQAMDKQAKDSEIGTNLHLMQTFGPGVTMEGLRANPGALTQAPGADAGGDPLAGAIQAWHKKRQGAQEQGSRATESEIRLRNAQAGKLEGKSVPGAPTQLEPQQRASIEGSIMDDYMKSPTFARFSAAKSGLRDLASIQANKSGAADIAAIYSFVKTMDDNAVKEGEISLAQSALPGLDRVKVIYDKMKSGNTLTPALKKELLTASRSMYDSKLKSADEFRKPFMARAQQYGINPDIAAPGFAIPEAELQAMFGEPAPAPGAGDIVLQGPQGKRLADLRAKAAQAKAGTP